MGKTDRTPSADNGMAAGRQPPADLLFRRRLRPGRLLLELWGARELVRSLAERDIRARYKQTSLGFGWAILTPLLMMGVFVVFFQHVARVKTGAAPYALFSYLGLLPWTFFSTAVNLGGQNMVLNNALLNKVYCPREVFPLSSVAVALFDMTIASAILVLMFPLFRYGPRATSVWVPVLFLVQMTFTSGVVLFVAIVLIYVRDLRTILPLLLQFGLFATPVAYPLASLPHGSLRWYVAINPLAAVIDDYRRVILYGRAPDWPLFLIAATSSVLYLTAGFVTFKRYDRGIADLA